ncbi:hypothetical protein BN903_96 [Halorubrum sp. AJ67]|nr:hypothetical protein BN903_96 [Halorubrum sp. AJ67]
MRSLINQPAAGAPPSGRPRRPQGVREGVGGPEQRGGPPTGRERSSRLQPARSAGDEVGEA